MKKFIFLWIMLAGNVQAQINVTPVMLIMKSSDKLVKVELANKSSYKRHFQVTIKNWHQQEGKDVLTSADNWIVSPAIFSMEPGKSQLVRLGVKDKKPQESEQSFRVLVEEITEKAETFKGHIRVNLNISLPLFVETGSTQLQPLKASLNGATLTVSNPNNHHVEVISMGSGQGQVALPGYVLAHQTRKFSLPKGVQSSDRKLNISYLSQLSSVNVSS